jgi:UDP-N-acetyl-2-amino-2-deoxyglucuronate dehydrogenase
MNPINFAVVGCGHIGSRHAEMILRNPEASLRAIVDIRPADQLKFQCTDVPVFRSIDELVDSGTRVDVVVIATPNAFHFPQAMKCLDAGFHVVIEKPMTLRRSDAEALLFKALSVNRLVFSVMQNRYSPPSVWLKNIIENGVLGSIYMVQLSCFWNRDERYYHPDSWHGSKTLDGGTLFTQFSHFIDIMYWLFGDIENINSNIACFNHHELTDFEDSGSIVFDFVNGGMGSLNFTTSVWNCNLESSMTVIGENGSIKVGGQYMNHVEYCHIRDYTMPVLAPTNPANDYGIYKGSASNHHYVIQNVVNVLKGREPIHTNALEGLKVVDMIERMYASARPGISNTDKVNRKNEFNYTRYVVSRDIQTKAEVNQGKRSYVP